MSSTYWNSMVECGLVRKTRALKYTWGYKAWEWTVLARERIYTVIQQTNEHTSSAKSIDIVQEISHILD